MPPRSMPSTQSRRRTRRTSSFDVATGPVYRVTDLAIQGPPDIVGYPGLDRSKLTLAPGKPADADRHPGDRGPDPRPGEGPRLRPGRGRAARSADRSRHARGACHLRRRAGSAARMGPVRFSGTEKVDTTYLQRRVPFEEGDPYTPAKVNALRDRLTGARRVQLGAHQARDGAQRQGRAADRRRAHGPRAAHDRLRRELRDHSRLRA